MDCEDFEVDVGVWSDDEASDEFDDDDLLVEVEDRFYFKELKKIYTS